MSETPTGTDRVELTDAAVTNLEVLAAIRGENLDRQGDLIAEIEAERDAARAELAAANARCAELEARLEDCRTSLNNHIRSEDALQATLDRVSEVYGFLMRKYADPDADAATVLAVTRTSLRAALTPEGKHVNCNCDDCDEERSLDPTPKGRP